MKLFLALGMIFLVLPSALSFSCDQFTGQTRQDCIDLSAVNESLVAGLIYTNTSIPIHTFVQAYNDAIQVTGPPNGTPVVSKEYIKDAWVRIISNSPSILYNGSLFAPRQVQVRSAYNYSIHVPAAYSSSIQKSGAVCKIVYSLSSQSSALTLLKDGSTVGSDSKVDISIASDSEIISRLDVSATILADQSVWSRYCCARSNGKCTKYCYRCQFQSTTYKTETLTVEDAENLKFYSKAPEASAQLEARYFNTTRGLINKSLETSIVLKTENSSLEWLKFEYVPEFSIQPYDFIVLEAVPQESKKLNNLFLDGSTFFVASDENCSLIYFDFFQSQKKSCDFNYSNISQREYARSPGIADFSLLMKLAVFAFILYGTFRVAKHYWGRYFLAVILLFLVIPDVHAEDCGITNLASCIPQKIYDFFLSLINAPLQPLLSFLRTLLESAPSIDLFSSIWTVIVYCISFFYVFLIIYAGFQFMFSGHDVVRREMAKEWLKNTVIMIVLIQASFYLYGLFLSLGSALTSAFLSLVDKNFFLLTADNLVNIGLQFIFTLSYLVVLLVAILFLVIRYLLVSIGVIFLPIGIFCFFIPPLRSYGKIILNLLGMLVLITALDALIILGCSKLLTVDIFQNFKIIVMVCCLLIIDFLFILLGKHIISKAGLEDASHKMAEAAKYIGMLA